MSFLSPKDFSDAYKVKYNTLRAHISRGKIIKTDNLIDTEHPTNRVYIQELKIKKPIATAIQKIKKNASKPEIKTDSPPENITDKKLSSLIARKQKAETLKAERDAEFRLLQIQEKQGKLMPTELVEKIQTINTQSIFRSFESACENIATIYNEKLGGDRSDLADMINRMRQELYRSIKDSEEKSAEEIKGLLKDYVQLLKKNE